MDVWWRKNSADLRRLQSLKVWSLSDDAVADLASLARRNMKLQCTIQEGQIAFSDGDEYVVVQPERLE